MLLALDALVAALAPMRDRGARIVTTNGCFDLLHPGHVRLLARARALGDVLVVLLNGDASVRALKGPGRPVRPAGERAEMLLALRSVDFVTVFDERDASPALLAIHPHVHCKGGDCEPNTLPEAAALRECGAEVRILPYWEGHSTTALAPGRRRG